MVACRKLLQLCEIYLIFACCVHALGYSRTVTDRSSIPTFEDCSTWSRVSSGDAQEEALHSRMCNRTIPSGTVTDAPRPLVIPHQSHEVSNQESSDIKAIAEAVLEVLPSSQQNFALLRDGAKVLASNPGAKKVAAILDDDSDTFMRNDCKDDKWVVVELSQVAKVSKIELSQDELYSSRIKDFEVRGRQSHPRTDNVETSKGLNSTAWKLLGRFTAEKAKGTQLFPVDRELWAHYLLVRFLTHYGSEPVCAVNGIAVYGKSAAEELEDQLAEDDVGLTQNEGIDQIDQGGGEGREGEGGTDSGSVLDDRGENDENTGRSKDDNTDRKDTEHDQNVAKGIHYNKANEAELADKVAWEGNESTFPSEEDADDMTKVNNSNNSEHGSDDMGGLSKPPQVGAVRPTTLSPGSDSVVMNGGSNSSSSSKGAEVDEGSGTKARHDSPSSTTHMATSMPSSPTSTTSSTSPGPMKEEDASQLPLNNGKGTNMREEGNTPELSSLKPSRTTMPTMSNSTVSQANSTSVAVDADDSNRGNELETKKSKDNNSSSSIGNERDSAKNDETPSVVASTKTKGSGNGSGGGDSRQQQHASIAGPSSEMAGDRITVPAPKSESLPSVVSVNATDTGAKPTASSGKPTQSQAVEEDGMELFPLDILEPIPVPKVAKSGGGVYDVLIQEIRATKAHQRMTAKAIEALQRNLTAASISLSRMKTEYELSESDLASRVDMLMKNHLGSLETQVIAMQKALHAARKREHAALSLLAMMSGALLLSIQGVSTAWPSGVKRAIVVLALGNGAVAGALHWQSNH